MNWNNKWLHFLKLFNNNDTIDNIELSRFIFEQLKDKNILIEIIEKLENNEKYFYKINNLAKNKDLLNSI